MFKVAAKVLAAASILSVTGCASIVSDTRWPVTLDTKPTGATCTVANENGVSLYTGQTPISMTLKSSSGFFSYAVYKIECKKDGFLPAKTEMEADLNGWYWGNLVFGGLIGWFIVDPATGAMWRMEKTQTLALTQQEKGATQAAVVPPQSSVK